MKNLKQTCLKDYGLKDRDMPDCPICLVTFVEDDDLIVFACDPKHYFHKTCGSDWLVVKSECPLCRHDFSKKIGEFIAKDGDIINEVAREAAQSREEATQELVSEITSSIIELHHRIN